MKKLIYSSLIAVSLSGLCSKKVCEQEDNTVYNYVSLETQPTYPGGIIQFYKFLGENIKYPKQAKDENIQGNVLVSFTVEKDGALTEIKVDRKLGGGADEEAVRVLKLCTAWEAGTINNKPVRVKYNIPIRFTLPSQTPKI